MQISIISVNSSICQENQCISCEMPSWWNQKSNLKMGTFLSLTSFIYYYNYAKCIKYNTCYNTHDNSLSFNKNEEIIEKIGVFRSTWWQPVSGTKTGAESVIQNSAKMINKHAAIIWKIRALLPHPSNPRDCVSYICRSQLPPNFWKVSQSSILLLKYLSRPLAAWLDQAALPEELWTEKQEQILPTTKECYNIRCAITVLHFLIIWHIFFQSLCWLSIEIFIWTKQRSFRLNFFLS